MALVVTRRTEARQLITRRSLVQIQPPPPFAQVRAGPSGPALTVSGPTSHAIPKSRRRTSTEEPDVPRSVMPSGVIESRRVPTGAGLFQHPMRRARQAVITSGRDPDGCWLRVWLQGDGGDGPSDALAVAVRRRGHLASRVCDRVRPLSPRGRRGPPARAVTRPSARSGRGRWSRCASVRGARRAGA